MKKFAAGVLIGAVFSSATVMYASNSIQALIWPIELEVNHTLLPADPDRPVLNYNGEAYVPVRYIAEQLGFGVAYNSMDQVLSIQYEPGDGDLSNKRIWQAQYVLNRGKDQAFVKKLFNEPDFIFKSDQNRAVWRYDFGAQEAYRSDTSQIDNSSLAEGSIRAQLFIDWSDENDTIDQILLGYSKKYGELQREYVYYLFPDGSTLNALVE